MSDDEDEHGFFHNPHYTDRGRGFASSETVDSGNITNFFRGVSVGDTIHRTYHSSYHDLPNKLLQLQQLEKMVKINPLRGPHVNKFQTKIDFLEQNLDLKWKEIQGFMKNGVDEFDIAGIMGIKELSLREFIRLMKDRERKKTRENKPKLLVNEEENYKDIVGLVKSGVKLEVIANMKNTTLEEILAFMHLKSISIPTEEEVLAYNNKKEDEKIKKPKIIEKKHKSNFYNPKEIVEVDLTWDQFDQMWGNFIHKNNLVGMEKVGNPTSITTTPMYYHQEKKEMEISKKNMIKSSKNNNNEKKYKSEEYSNEVHNLMKDLEDVSKFSMFIRSDVAPKIEIAIGNLMYEKSKGLESVPEIGIPYSEICVYLDRSRRMVSERNYERKDIREALKYLMLVKIVREVGDDLFVASDFAFD